MPHHLQLCVFVVSFSLFLRLLMVTFPLRLLVIVFCSAPAMLCVCRINTPSASFPRLRNAIYRLAHLPQGPQPRCCYRQDQARARLRLNLDQQDQAGRFGRYSSRLVDTIWRRCRIQRCSRSCTYACGWARGAHNVISFFSLSRRSLCDCRMF